MKKFYVYTGLRPGRQILNTLSPQAMLIVYASIHAFFPVIAKQKGMPEPKQIKCIGVFKVKLK